MAAIYGHENSSTTVSGSTSSFLELRNMQLHSGRAFSDSEARAGAAVAIIGQTVREKLFGSQDPVNNRIRLGALSFQVIGLLESKGQNSMGMDQDDIVLLPLGTFQRRMSGNQDVSMLQVSVRDGESTEKAQRDIRLLVRDRRYSPSLTGRKTTSTSWTPRRSAECSPEPPRCSPACSARSPR